MSKSEIDAQGASSIMHLEEVQTREEVEERRRGEKWLWESSAESEVQSPFRTGAQSEFSKLSKSERIEFARELMEDGDPTTVKIDVGELAQLNDSTLVKRTNEGIVLYNILDY